VSQVPEAAAGITLAAAEPVSRPGRFREVPLALVFLLPSLVLFGAFIFYPLVRTMWLGLYRSDPFGLSSSYVGFAQYRSVLSSATFRHSLGVTLRFAILTVPTGLALGLGLALLAHQRLRGITIFRTIFSSTVATSVAVASVMFLTLLNPSIGLVNYALREAGRSTVDPLTNVHWALPAVAATTVWQNLGFTFIVLIAGLQTIPEELYESARIDGAGGWSQFRNVTLPLLSPTLLFAFTVLTINAFQSFGQIDILTQGGPAGKTNVIVYNLYQTLRRAHDPNLAAAQATILFVFVLVLTFVQFRFLERRVFYGNG
jgi:sn-glycerol 3-phosphate transport system permease protein